MEITTFFQMYASKRGKKIILEVRVKWQLLQNQFGVKRSWGWIFIQTHSVPGLGCFFIWIQQEPGVTYIITLATREVEAQTTCSRSHHLEPGAARNRTEACLTSKPTFYLKSVIFRRNLWNRILSWETKEHTQIQ